MSSPATSSVLENVERCERENDYKELPSVTYWQDRILPDERLRILPSTTAYQGFPSLSKLRKADPWLLELSLDFDRPWLPPEAHRLIQKMKQSPLSEKEVVDLMRTLAQRTIEHYGFRDGECLAISFEGKLMDSANSRIDLLRRIQGAPYSGGVFVWEVGSESLAGWI